MLELLDDDVAGLGLLRQKAHRHRIIAGLRQGHAGLGRPFAQQQVGNLDQAARAIAHFGIGAHRAAMIQIDKELKALRDDIMGFFAFDIGDESHTAGVMLVGGVIKPLLRRRRCAGHSHNLIPHPTGNIICGSPLG